MASKAKKLKLNTGNLGDLLNREVSARRQVGDAESTVNAPNDNAKAQPWWRNVTMEEGM